jgi:hypothetical protein
MLIKSTCYPILILMVCCLLPSCATIFNRPNQHVVVRTTKPTKLIYNNDTISTEYNRAVLHAKRQKKPLEFAVLTDTGAKTVKVESYLSFAYIANIFTYGNIPGLLIDLYTDKRFAYPKILLNDDYSINSLKKSFVESKKGDFLLNISFPMGNWFYLRPDGEPEKNIVGVLGFSMGLDYFHSQKQFLNLSATEAVDVPDIGYRYGKYEKESTRYLSLSNNHVLNRFTIGYGLSYAHNAWEFVNGPGRRDSISTPLTGRPSQSKSNNALGLVFSGYFKIIAGVNMGVIYRPTFMRFGSADKYEHLVSFDFGYRIPLHKKTQLYKDKRPKPKPPLPWPFGKRG